MLGKILDSRHLSFTAHLITDIWFLPNLLSRCRPWYKVSLLIIFDISSIALFTPKCSASSAEHLHIAARTDGDLLQGGKCQRSGNPQSSISLAMSLFLPPPSPPLHGHVLEFLVKVLLTHTVYPIIDPSLVIFGPVRFLSRLRLIFLPLSDSPLSIDTFDATHSIRHPYHL